MRSPVKFENIIFEEKSLHVPELDEIVQVLQSALSRNFQEVTVEIVDCPNLTAEPYSLVCEGLNGSLTLMELGGFATLLPLEDKGKVYDIVETSRKIMKGKDLAIIGTGAGPVSLEKSNCEIILNMNIPLKGNLENKSIAIRINEDDEISLDPINDQQIFSYLVNIFLCEGKSGKVKFEMSAPLNAVGTLFSIPNIENKD
uniref:DUF1907 domain-containing protein n=1 Tax=Megaselia scalaris TaxID=36166 RepID=T1GJ03_MEGSC